MKPFFSTTDKTNWLANNCEQCSVSFMCNLLVFINIENISTEMASKHIGIAFDGFLEPNCKNKVKRLTLKNPK